MHTTPPRPETLTRPTRPLNGMLTIGMLPAVTLLALTLLAPALAAPAGAAVRSQAVEYSHGDTQLQGHVFYDDAVPGERPGVLVVHEWWGLNEHAKDKARALAELGYVAFATDMYGAGKVTDHPGTAGEWAGAIRKNVETWRARADAGLAQLAEHPKVDESRLAAIGYCFGGATVLQMAYGGSELLGVASFHGSLPLPPGKGAIGPAVQVHHGAADPFSSKDDLTAFVTAMNDAEVDWQMNLYGDAVHSFTNEAADERDMDGIGYDADADRRSWAAMERFFDELFE